MAPNPIVMKAVETLNYRVTVGDVASQVGLDIKVAEQALLGLASEAGGHMQVAESGEIAYLFPRNFRDIVRNKYWRLRFQESWNKVWRIVFYLIRISFGAVLMASIALIFIAIFLIMIAANSSNDRDGGWGDSSGHSGGGMGFPIWNWWFFSPDYGYYDSPQRRSRVRGEKSELNFLEAIFSFLFGDGNPNADLEERRWQAIATVIRNNGGAIVAEQVVPYLDNLGERYQQEYEDYMLPVLTRFNGRPEVSPDGQLIYHFPELQVKATQRKINPVAAYLRETAWKFSQASSGQIIGAIALGGVNLVGALMLGSLLRGGVAAQLGGLVGFVAGIYGVLLAYGIGFLAIPLIRYFWVQWRNQRIEARNQQRQQRAVVLNAALNAADDTVKQKLAFAQQFTTETIVDEADLAYTTETDLTEQELRQADKIDAEWMQRLEQAD
ncbi:hypothetical protein IFO70_12845 [Phormidium tenue FACHB-886]|nr:hypothetical protein [Phormidium tenue FACHB-886]